MKIIDLEYSEDCGSDSELRLTINQGDIIALMDALDRALEVSKVDEPFTLVLPCLIAE